MKNKLYLYEPELKDYWYEEKLLKDPKTMSYNAGWDVFYDGYHFDTGCIDFPKEKWASDYNKRNNKDKFFRYIVRKEDDKYIGYVNFHITNNKCEIGILLENTYRGLGYGKVALSLLINEAFNNYGIDKLYDSFEEKREKSCKCFFDLGFKEVNRFKMKRFNKDMTVIEICLENEK